ncbi:aminomethyl-transferring glycine dehydrogenase subunit GcvPA [Rubeoparvulum massiliense]|uniref:aminomethyl-transferring glycine dehydrogenase subunit GcvPA n=1 Tax=Rubeoparvulum massiliense TaxID=1631346 RepID=UPI00065E72AC|nr:aminomethyl-transferring glycine dehydrogenase subunit GcvPA [Rubeoparvulum massiliense]
MQFRYLPMTGQDRKEMLAVLGLDSIEPLLADIPADVRLQRELALEPAMSEVELIRHMSKLSTTNRSLDEMSSFLGAGIYDHYIPSVVSHITGRSEFATAYTPYQPEISQGELQAIFEYQSMICELTGMEVANSSMYDGATALAEAAVMVAHHSKRSRILVSRAVHPESREVLATYGKGQNLEIAEIGWKEGITDLAALEAALDEETAGVIIQYPNFFGSIEDLAQIAELVHAHQANLIVSANPLALALLEAPGKLGADVVIGDAQPFGIAPAFGGPSCGYFATTSKLMRKMPGRIVGQTTDDAGNRGFVLTLQAREQHIRREKATSNICSNQALNALAAAVAMTALGKQGAQEMALLNLHKSHYASEQLKQVPGIQLVFSSPFFNEFVIRLNVPVRTVNQRLLEAGIIGGYDLGRTYPELEQHMLICVTEKRTKAEIDQLVQVLGGLEDA